MKLIFPWVLDCGMLILCPGNYLELSSVQQMCVEHLQHIRRAFVKCSVDPPQRMILSNVIKRSKDKPSSKI